MVDVLNPATSNDPYVRNNINDAMANRISALKPINELNQSAFNFSANFINNQIQRALEEKLALAGIESSENQQDKALLNDLTKTTLALADSQAGRNQTSTENERNREASRTEADSDREFQRTQGELDADSALRLEQERGAQDRVTSAQVASQASALERQRAAALAEQAKVNQANNEQTFNAIPPRSGNTPITPVAQATDHARPITVVDDGETNVIPAPTESR